MVQKPRPAPLADETTALAVLGLAPGADADAIQAAWRARMAQAHPDAGGSDDAARAVTAARDLLLARRRT
jgi:curved DNA-binding protein CbpA